MSCSFRYIRRMFTLRPGRDGLFSLNWIGSRNRQASGCFGFPFPLLSVLRADNYQPQSVRYAPERTPVIRAATGHRPNKLGGYGPAITDRLRRGARRFLEAHRDTTEAVGGMALGWDTGWALAALDIGVPLTAAVPFKGQESRWPVESQRLYHWILSAPARS
jgi:hypothetical protein